MISARPAPHNRPLRVAFSETRGCNTFTEPELVLTSDALYTSLAKIYGMIVFPYGGKFVEMMWIYHVDPHIADKYVGGATDWQLAHSYNGWHFQRTRSVPLFPTRKSALPASANPIRGFADCRLSVNSGRPPVVGQFELRGFRGR